MKRILGIFGLMMIFAIPIQISAVANSDFTVKDGMISSYNGNETYVEIPAIIDDVEIAGIDQYAFMGNKNIQTVVIDEGIEVIQSYAFADCANLKTIELPDSLILICTDAFDKCYSLKDLDIPPNTDVMDGFSIPAWDKKKITGTGTKRMSKASADDYVISGNKITQYTGAETELTIPSEINGVTITSIGASAFEGNTDITSVIIPDTVTSIGGGAFSDCSSLISINVNESNSNYTSENGILFNKNKTNLVCYPAGIDGVYTIPNTVTSIEKNAFKGCTGLENVTLPSNLSSVGTGAFRGCTALEEITIPGTLKTVGSYMFEKCNGLKSVVLSEGVEKIDGYAFYECSNLVSIEIPSTLNYINTWAMGYCKKLKSFDLPYGVTYLGDASFYYCNVINNIHMPDTVTYMGTHCFRGCWALSDIVLSNSIKTITYRAFHNCAFKSITIPESVTSIGVEPFWYCQKLEAINIPSKVTSIGNQAFYNCTALKNVVMYENIKSIGSNIFKLLSGQQNPNIVVYSHEGSYAEGYCKTNSIETRPMVSVVTPVAGMCEIGTICKVNYPFTQNIKIFGTKYIPKQLYDSDSDYYLDIAYNETELADGNTYLTIITDVPYEARYETYVATPYFELTNGTVIVGPAKSFSIANTVMNIVREAESYEVE